MKAKIVYHLNNASNLALASVAVMTVGEVRVITGVLAGIGLIAEKILKGYAESEVKPADIKKLRDEVDGLQIELNKIMGKKVSSNDKVFNLCNKIHSALVDLRDELSAEKLKNTKRREIAAVLRSLNQNLSEAKNELKKMS